MGQDPGDSMGVQIPTCSSCRDTARRVWNHVRCLYLVVIFLTIFSCCTVILGYSYVNQIERDLRDKISLCNQWSVDFNLPKGLTEENTGTIYTSDAGDLLYDKLEDSEELSDLDLETHKNRTRRSTGHKTR